MLSISRNCLKSLSTDGLVAEQLLAQAAEDGSFESYDSLAGSIPSLLLLFPTNNILSDIWPAVLEDVCKRIDTVSQSMCGHITLL
jgi:hypothetical protein